MPGGRGRAHTIGLIRMLTELGGATRRPHRMPAQRQPDLIRLEYHKAIVRLVCEPAAAAFHRYRDEILRDHASTRHDSRYRADARGQAERLVQQAAAHFTDLLRPTALHAVAAQFGHRTSAWQKDQLDAQVRAAIGVPYSAIEKPVRDQVEGWAALNVDLIRTVPERYFDRLRQDVIDAYTSGTHTSTLADQLQADYDISEDDAERIARDQVGKLNAQVNQERQTSLGVTTYVWRTAGDNRVRDNHYALEGQSYSWDDPPLGGGTDETETGHPGEGIQCRCYAEPDFSDILQ